MVNAFFERVNNFLVSSELLICEEPSFKHAFEGHVENHNDEMGETEEGRRLGEICRVESSMEQNPLRLVWNTFIQPAFCHCSGQHFAHGLQELRFCDHNDGCTNNNI